MGGSDFETRLITQATADADGCFANECQTVCCESFAGSETCENTLAPQGQLLEGRECLSGPCEQQVQSTFCCPMGDEFVLTDLISICVPEGCVEGNCETICCETSPGSGTCTDVSIPVGGQFPSGRECVAGSCDEPASPDGSSAPCLGNQNSEQL